MVGTASAADKIKVGFFSTLEGPYTALGEDGQRDSISQSCNTTIKRGARNFKSSEHHLMPVRFRVACRKEISRTGKG